VSVTTSLTHKPLTGLRGGHERLCFIYVHICWKLIIDNNCYTSRLANEQLY
jgi:hypothetical protein